MASPDTAALDAALESYVDPLIGCGLISAGCVKQAALNNGRASLQLELGFPAAGYRATLIQALQAHLRSELKLESDIELSWCVQSQAVQEKLKPIPQVRNIIAVASGKGGVGKSTVSANLALALQAEGARVGVLDADIYGPSQPRMLGSSAKPTSPDGSNMHPIQTLGLQAMSIGFLISEEQPMIWRGPMVTQALMQLINETRWKDLDYLIIDLPPGTGDTQLTLSQRIPVSGAVIVTTPQDIALLDARKGLEMFRKVSVPVLGVVENMSLFHCPHCGETTEIFGAGGGQNMAQQYDVELLGQIPLDAQIRLQADSGKPSVAADPESPVSRIYRDIARKAAARLAYGDDEQAFPEITISDD